MGAFEWHLLANVASQRDGLRDFLARRHKIKGRGTNRFSYNVVYGERGVLRLERLPWSLAPCASR